jgi:hypothetical protein
MDVFNKCYYLFQIECDHLKLLTVSTFK